MKIARFSFQGSTQHGVLEDEVLYALEGDLFGRFQQGRRLAILSQVKLLAPVVPSKIIAIGRNYRAHIAELGSEAPKEPLLFLKPPTSLLDPEEAIVYPAMSRRVDHEGELAVIMGTRAKDLKEEEVAASILGYTCANDVTARDLQQQDGQWTRAKSFDTFCPLGPVIATDLAPGNLLLRCRVNGQTRQESSTSLLIFPVARVVSHISRVMTLLPGDVILTGTPSGIGPLAVGDEVEVEIEGIGVLRNRVVAPP